MTYTIIAISSIATISFLIGMIRAHKRYKKAKEESKQVELTEKEFIELMQDEVGLDMKHIRKLLKVFENNFKK